LGTYRQDTSLNIIIFYFIKAEKNVTQVKETQIIHSTPCKLSYKLATKIAETIDQIPRSFNCHHWPVNCHNWPVDDPSKEILAAFYQ
jgi:hypothetical protein